MKASSLKGNQIIKQIVKIVLPSAPSDVVQLQPGRRKKPTGNQRTKKPTGKKKAKGPGTLPPTGPTGPTGVLSHITHPGAPQPPSYPSVFGANLPRPFAQTPFQTPFQSPFEKMFFEKLRETPKETPTVVSSKTPMASISMPSAITPQTPAITLAGKSGEELAKVIFDRARARSQSRSGQMMAEEIPRPAIASPLLRMQPLSGAPNQAVQPSVDVDGDGKEAMKLQPQAPAITFVQAQKAPSSSSSSSSGGDGGMFYEQPPEDEEEEETPYDEDMFSQPNAAPPGGGSARASSSSTSDVSVSDEMERANLLQEATMIRDSLMKITGTPNPNFYTTKGKLTAVASRYLLELEAYLSQLKRPGTPLQPVPKMKK